MATVIPLRRAGNAAKGSFYQDFTAGDDLDMQGGQVKYVADATDPTDAVTLQQLEDAVADGDASTAGATVWEALAAEAMAIGDPVYKTAVTERYGKARADDELKAVVMGITLDAPAAAGDPIRVLNCGCVDDAILVGATPGTPYYLAPAGGLTVTLPTSGRIWQIGVAHTETRLAVRLVDQGSIPIPP